MKTKRVGAVALLLALVLSLAGCGKSLEKQLPGSWYLGEPYFIFYDGGTWNALNGYHGTWAVVNGNQLKLTNSYGEGGIVTIESLKNGCLKLSDGGITSTFWNTPQGK